MVLENTSDQGIHLRARLGGKKVGGDIVYEADVKLMLSSTEAVKGYEDAVKAWESAESKEARERLTDPRGLIDPHTGERPACTVDIDAICKDHGADPAAVLAELRKPNGKRPSFFTQCERDGRLVVRGEPEPKAKKG